MSEQKLVLILQASKRDASTPPKDCPHCEGRGGTECEACDGDGEFEHYGYHYTCKTCDRTGKHQCGYCDDTGTWEAYQLYLESKRIREKIKNRYGTPNASVRDWWVRP